MCIDAYSVVSNYIMRIDTHRLRAAPHIPLPRYPPAMARKPTPEEPSHGPAYGFALRLQSDLAEDPSLDADPPHERPGGPYGANAAFEFRNAEGRAFLVIVARQS